MLLSHKLPHVVRHFFYGKAVTQGLPRNGEDPGPASKWENKYRWERVAFCSGLSDKLSYLLPKTAKHSVFRREGSQNISFQAQIAAVPLKLRGKKNSVQPCLRLSSGAWHNSAVICSFLLKTFCGLQRGKSLCLASAPGCAVLGVAVTFVLCLAPPSLLSQGASRKLGNLWWERYWLRAKGTGGVGFP